MEDWAASRSPCLVSSGGGGREVRFTLQHLHSCENDKLLTGFILFFQSRCLVECVQNSLSRGPGDLVDLASLNIARGHERGMPGYTVFRNREECDIEPKVNSFDDLLAAGFAEADVENLRNTYESVHDVDLFPAGMYIFYCYPGGGGEPQGSLGDTSVDGLF